MNILKKPARSIPAEPVRLSLKGNVIVQFYCLLAGTLLAFTIFLVEFMFKWLHLSGSLVNRALNVCFNILTGLIISWRRVIKHPFKYYTTISISIIHIGF